MTALASATEGARGEGPPAAWRMHVHGAPAGPAAKGARRKLEGGSMQLWSTAAPAHEGHAACPSSSAPRACLGCSAMRQQPKRAQRRAALQMRMIHLDRRVQLDLVARSVDRDGHGRSRGEISRNLALPAAPSEGPSSSSSRATCKPLIRRLRPPRATLCAARTSSLPSRRGQQRNGACQNAHAKSNASAVAGSRKTLRRGRSPQRVGLHGMAINGRLWAESGENWMGGSQERGAVPDAVASSVRAFARSR